MPLSPFEWVSLSLIALGLIVPSAFALTFVIQNKLSDPRAYVALALITLFSFAVVATFGIIIAQGLARLTLATSLLNWLGAATIGEIAGMLHIIIKAYFSKGDEKREQHQTKAKETPSRFGQAGECSHGTTPLHP